MLEHRVKLQLHSTAPTSAERTIMFESNSGATASQASNSIVLTGYREKLKRYFLPHFLKLRETIKEHYPQHELVEDIDTLTLKVKGITQDDALTIHSLYRSHPLHRDPKSNQYQEPFFFSAKQEGVTFYNVQHHVQSRQVTLH